MSTSVAVTNFSIENPVGKTHPSSDGFVQNAAATFLEVVTVGFIAQKDESNPSTTLDDVDPVLDEDGMVVAGVILGVWKTGIPAVCDAILVDNRADSFRPDDLESREMVPARGRLAKLLEVVTLDGELVILGCRVFTLSGNLLPLENIVFILRELFMLVIGLAMLDSERIVSDGRSTIDGGVVDNEVSDSQVDKFNVDDR